MTEPEIETRLVNVGGLTFCPYHLPYSSEALECDHNAAEDVNHPDLKKNWSEDRIIEFDKDIHQRLENAYKAGTKSNLTGIVFPGPARFVEKKFREVDFSHSKFAGGLADFSDAHFSGGYTSFEEAEFDGGSAIFTRAEFSGGDADFRGVLISGGAAVFEDVRFSGGSALFMNARFSGGPTIFRNAQFSGGNALFMHAQFPNAPTFFDNAQFSGGLASFSIFIVSETRSPSDSGFQTVTFDHAVFSIGAHFDNRQFLGGTHFRSTTFTQAPEFYGCRLHHNTTFPPIENFKDTCTPNAAHAYRTLRLAMKQQEAHEEEAMFWALEQRSKRSNLDLKRPGNWLPWGLSWMYEAISAYGLSETRPLLWFGVWAAVIAPLIYFFLRNPIDQLAKPVGYSDILGFSLAQSVRPFFIWGDYDGSDIKSVLGEHIDPLSVKLFATADSLISLVLIALFILAVRRRFRMQ